MQFKEQIPTTYYIMRDYFENLKLMTIVLLVYTIYKI